LAILPRNAFTTGGAGGKFLLPIFPARSAHEGLRPDRALFLLKLANGPVTIGFVHLRARPPGTFLGIGINTQIFAAFPYA